MAERERMTNKERRAAAREERKRKEAEASRKRKRNAIRNGAIAAVVFGVVAAVVLQAVLGGPETIDDPILISSDEVSEATEAAGCEVLVERDPLPDSSHFEASSPPPADAIYPDIRPTHSGPHTVQTHPPISDGASNQIDEKTSTHNLEHGAIIVWYDPEQVDQDTADELGEWAASLNASGFGQDGGSIIFVSPYEDPGISSGQALAYRAWGTAMDCDEWDETVANGFVAEHYGTRGLGPEAPAFAPYPEGVLDFEDGAPEPAEPQDEDDEAEGDTLELEPETDDEDGGDED